MNEIYIYKLIDPITQHIRYVGKTLNLKQRLRNHIKRCKINKYHSAVWINSLFNKGLEPIIEIIEICNESNWTEREKYWISFYKNIYDLTNILDGGDGGATYGRLGKPWTNQQRKNNRKARFQVPVCHTPEGKNNRAIGLRKYLTSIKVPVYQYSIHGIFIKKWDSAVDAASALNLSHSNIGAVCKGQRNHTGKFIWRFYLTSQ